MIERKQLGTQKADCRCPRNLGVLLEVIASSLSSIKAAKEEILKDIHDHQALVYASAFLSKKYEENQQMMPSRSQLESYVAEFHHGSYYAALNVVPSLTI